RALRMNEDSTTHEISPSEDGAQKFISDYRLKLAAWLGKLVTNNICSKGRIPKKFNGSDEFQLPLRLTA
ncbi:MAG: hypothetical protein N3B10_12755, partial [Armatimonadetes bacterium]|nr:hypothetical protein [Armatimonadota bacterium]